jgi:hypothetical protein
LISNKANSIRKEKINQEKEQKKSVRRTEEKKEKEKEFGDRVIQVMENRKYKRKRELGKNDLEKRKPGIKYKKMILIQLWRV